MKPLDSAETFQNDPIYRNAAALCILQIGELVGKLTDEFRAQHPAVPWRQIKAMRNIVAHSYGTVDPETTWEIITDDIPALKQSSPRSNKQNVPLGSSPQMERSKMRKATLMGLFFCVSLGYALTGRLTGTAGRRYHR